MHTILYRGELVSGSPTRDIKLSEWVDAAKHFERFVVTDKLKQQNPFTQEFLLADIPGCGYWTPTEGAEDTWSNDKRIWFHFLGRAVVFIQFADFENSELLEVAQYLGAKTANYRISAA